METKAHTDCPGSCLHPRSLQSFHRVGAASTPTSQIRKLRRGEGLPEPRGCVAELSDCGAPTLSLSPTATPRFTPTFQFRVCVAFPPYPGSRTLLTEGRAWRVQDGRGNLGLLAVLPSSREKSLLPLQIHADLFNPWWSLSWFESSCSLPKDKTLPFDHHRSI